MTITNSGVLFNNANGSIIVTLPNNSVITANTSALTNTTPKVLANLVVLAGKSKFSQLEDVNTAGETTGDTVVYNQTTNTYNVQTFSLDSGEF
jgi:hypothetical protein